MYKIIVDGYLIGVMDLSIEEVRAMASDTGIILIRVKEG